MSLISYTRVQYPPSRCVAAHARRRVTDYSSRRTGGQEENRRRSQSGRVHIDQPGYSNGTGPRRSQDYSSRRSGGQEENSRRSREYGHRESASSMPAPTPIRAAEPLPHSPVQANPHVARRRSVDYASRRSGGEEENNRRSRDFSSGGGRRRGVSAGSASSPPTSPAWNPPSAPRSNFDSYAQERTPASSSPRILPKRRSQDYASRRSGGQEENRRRSGGFASPQTPPPTPPAAQSQPQRTLSSYEPSSTSASPPSSSWQDYSAGRPPIMRKRSTNYASRVSGGQEENVRRSRDFSAPASPGSQRSGGRVSPRGSAGSSSGSQYSSYTQSPSASPRSRSGSGDSHLSPPIIPKRRSTNYASRRPGGQEENKRRSGDFQSPVAGGSSSSGASTTRYDYDRRAQRRPTSASSTDGPQQRRSGDSDYVPLSSSARKPRSTADWISANSKSSSRERSPSGGAYGAPPRSPYGSDNGVVGGGISPAARAGAANAARRRSGSYQQRQEQRRRSNAQEENERPRNVDMFTGAIREPAREGPPRRRNSSSSRAFSAGSESYSPAHAASKKIKGVPREFVAAADSATYGRDEAEARPSNPADTDWTRIIVANLPAAFLVFAGIAAVDMTTGFDITRTAVRYGGPGAPPQAILAFWPTAIAATGALSALLTSLLSLEAFGLKGRCPECDAENKAAFRGVLGRSGNSDVADVECENCMADLRFDVEARKVYVMKGSDEKKAEALERGRQQALRIARMEADDASREGK